MTFSSSLPRFLLQSSPSQYVPMGYTRHTQQFQRLYDSSEIPGKLSFYKPRFSRLTVFKASRTALLTQRCQAIILSDRRQVGAMETTILCFSMELSSN